MASGRPTRSRYSSPFVNTNNNGVSGSSKAVADAAERPKTMLDKWVEPQLAKPKASFEEAGFARGGTVMNMAPLGTMPSAKVRKNAERAEALDGAGRVRRSETSNATTPETPEPPPVVARRRSLSTKAEDAELSPKTPQAQTSPQKSAQKTNPNPQKIGQSVFSLSDAPLPVPTPPTLLAPSYLPQPSPKPYVSVYQPQPTPPILQDVDPESGINLERTDKVVEHAVQVALDHRRYPTAYALRILYDEVRDKPDIVKVIEDIYSGHPKESQLHLFAGLMKEKKLEGKKDRTGEYYFNGDGSDPPPRLPFSAVKTALTYDVPPERPNSGGNLFNDSARRASLSFSIAGSPIDSLPFFKKQKTTHISPYPPLENGVPTRPLTLPGSNNSTSLVLPTRERRDSETSESSLSSVDEDLINTEVLSPEKKKRTTNNSSKSNSNSNHVGVGGGDAQIRLASANNKTSDNSSGPAPAEAQGHNSTSHPIAAPPKNGPKTYTFSTVTSTSTSTSTPTPTSTSTLSSSQPHANSNSDMAPAALLPALSTSSSMPFINSHKAKNAFKGQGRFEPENENRVRLKRAAREKTNISSNPPESFERFQPPVDVETASESGDIPPAPSRRPTKRRTLNNREAKNRYNGDSEDLSSPTLLSFQPDIAPGSVSTSRAGTPNAANRPTRRAKTGSGLRVKTSPVKKKGGIVAGIPRASGERNNTPVANGASSENKDENDDYCSACGGNGDLVCCDGCIRSFHFKCVDPPMIEDSLTDEAWFCNQCEYNHNPRPRDYSSRAFGPLLGNLESKNPSSFHLPKDIREYFENVRTGTEGEYEEAPLPPKPKGRAGYEEAPDYYRLKDSKGKAVLCHSCNGSASAPNRMIIPCSFCPLYWHLDCLDNPLAKEPPAGRQWKCPAHVDDLMDVLPAKLGPAHRLRKIKDSQPIAPSFPRGSRNYGNIEIENDPSDEEEDSGFFEESSFGKVYKLPEQGLKLDFIAKIKQQGGGMERYRRKLMADNAKNAGSAWSNSNVVQQQAALNLAALAAQNPQFGNTNLLYNTVLAEAPPTVIDMLSQADATKLTKKNLPKKERKSLAALKAWLNSIEGLDEAEGESHKAQAVEANHVGAGDAQEDGEDTEMVR